ncbi:MAG: diaminopimelate epimerase [Bacillota bacterium]
MRFTKMHGLGNDFVVIEDGPVDSRDYRDLAVRMCDRHFGVGGDGLIITGRDSECDIFMRIINSDGSEPEMCGNGIRCVAKYAWERGLVDKPLFSVKTLAGPIRPEVYINNGKVTKVKVDMGEPILTPRDIPVLLDTDLTRESMLSAGGRDFTFIPVSMGNPHCVIFVDEVDRVPVAQWGPVIENHPIFPRRTNVEFVQVLGPAEMRMKVWERGAGETLACGTGACATLVAAAVTQRTGRQAVIHLLGGDLVIEWSETNNHVYMTGPAAEVFSGEWKE